MALGIVSVTLYALVLGAVLPLYPSLYPKLFLAGTLAYVVPAAVVWVASLVAREETTGEAAKTSRFRDQSRLVRVSTVLLVVLFVPAAVYAPADTTDAAAVFAVGAIASLILIAVVLRFDIDQRLQSRLA
ncbi:hypothetical protein [Halosimplex halobium]|uniref:hypothetical protein n=1 Tax=Halosimplex halobium TaxID=3396618 RepID=UPI003F5440F0